MGDENSRTATRPAGAATRTVRRGRGRCRPRCAGRRDRHDLKRTRRQRKRLGVGFEKSDPAVRVSRASFLRPISEHLVAERRRRCLHFRPPLDRMQRPGRRCRCTDRGSATRPAAALGGTVCRTSRGRCRATTDGSKIVPPGDLAEHLADAIGRFVDRHARRGQRSEVGDQNLFWRGISTLGWPYRGGIDLSTIVTANRSPPCPIVALMSTRCRSWWRKMRSPAARWW